MPMESYEIWRDNVVDILKYFIMQDKALRDWASGAADFPEALYGPEETLNWFDDIAVFTSSMDGHSPAEIEQFEKPHTFIDAMKKHEPNSELEKTLNLMDQVYLRVCSDNRSESSDDNEYKAFLKSDDWKELIALCQKALTALEPTHPKNN